MSKHWKLDDEARVAGAAGCFKEAAKIAGSLENQGPCPLSTAERDQVIELARGGIALLERLEETPGR